ncbi:hypothetical protein [Archangium sp.]|uniref:hypothetical protein n=1 Tax=Archangium sp. TaxID=1872627 RepID=UPI00389ADA09
MRTPLLSLALSLLATSALAKDRPTLHYKPGMDEERPVVVEAVVGPQGSDYALRLRFQKPPFGQECGNRCANATVLLDTDASALSGLKLPGKAAENGADLVLIIQGARDINDSSADHYLRVKVRRLTDSTRTVDEGELVTDLDHRRDSDRIHIEGNTVYLLIDAGNDLPSGRKVRVIYHPPGAKALQGTVPGLLSGSASNSKVMLFRRGTWGKAREGGQRVGSESK